MLSESPKLKADTSSSRARAVRRVLWITLALNLAVAMAKIVWGTMTHTLSMVADGYHSLLDGMGNVVGLVALVAAHRPPDEDHHYGHRKIEVLASIGVSILLFVAAAEILASAWNRFTGTDRPAIFSAYSIVIMLITMAVNFGVSRYEARRGRQLHSPFLIADSRHTASDLYASASVLVAVIALKLEIWWIDPVAALVIAVAVVRAGYSILKWSLGVLTDRALIAPSAIENIAVGFPRVVACRQVRTRGFADAVFVDLTVSFDPSMTLREAHDICDEIEIRIRQEFPEVDDIVVHMEPEQEEEILTGGTAPE